ncbi:MAG TPA: 50S ribosomal protein L15 [Candidatus Hydrogenedentes bacterium]|nr:50S ribosomal protein L15 [Candidatus Hydrogenedentota bacterium]HQH51633.1 50S ribosomal protein L15 [Candidatus Hydrogenedentota bacterium]HQM49956.1 50S ribosomal protein L15 [Candidatus Hydrogenedentota bacterium]
MDLSTLTQTPGARKKRKRVGRGPSSGHGKTSGKGHKGQNARSGSSRPRGFEGGQMPINRRLPKRGFYHEDRFAMAVVNVAALEKFFEAGAEVTPAALVKAGLVRASRGGVKVLGDGELTKKLSVKVNAVSESAREKIEAAGGSVELYAVPDSRANTRRGAGRKTNASTEG